MAGKPIPGHKFRSGITPTCQCGWVGAIHMGKGARAQAVYEWHSHSSKFRCLDESGTEVDQLSAAVPAKASI